MIIRLSKLRCMQWITRMNDHGCNNFVHLMQCKHTPPHRHTHTHYTLTPFCTFAALIFKNHSHCPTHRHKSTDIQNNSKQRWKASAEGKFCDVAELLTGHRKRSGLIKQSLCVPVSLDIKMLSTSTLLTLMLLSQRAYCVRERKERNKREEERKSKSKPASGRDK